MLYGRHLSDGIEHLEPSIGNFHMGLPSRKQRCHCCGWPCRVANSGEELEKFHFMWLGNLQKVKSWSSCSGLRICLRNFFRFINCKLGLPPVNPAFFGLSWCSDRRWVPRQRFETIWVRRKFSATKWFWIDGIYWKNLSQDGSKHPGAPEKCCVACFAICYEMMFAVLRILIGATWTGLHIGCAKAAHA